MLVGRRPKAEGPAVVDTSESVPSRYKVFLETFARLADAVRPVVVKFAVNALSKSLITEYNKCQAENPTVQEYDRASVLLSQILSKIKESDAHFDAFVAILKEVNITSLAHELKRAVYPTRGIELPATASGTRGESDSGSASGTESVNACGFQCPCGNCSLEKYFRDRSKCPKYQEGTFPFLNMTRLSEGDKETLEHRLIDDTNRIKREFQKVSDNVFNALKKQKTPVSEIRSTVFSSAEAGRPTPIQTLHGDKLETITELSDLKSFLIRYKYISFINYEILEEIVNKHCKECKTDLDNYLHTEFKDFSRRNVFEVPSDIFASSSTLDNLLVVKVIDEMWFGAERDASDCPFTLRDIKSIQNKIAKVIIGPGHGCGFIHLLDVNKGCIQLTFEILSCQKVPNSPFTTSQLSELIRCGIIVLYQPNLPSLPTNVQDTDKQTHDNQSTDADDSKTPPILSADSETPPILSADSETPPIPSADNSETPPTPSADNSETPPTPSADNSETPPTPSADNSETPPILSADNSETPPILSADNSETPPILSADSETPPVPTADDSETPPVPTADDSETPPVPTADDSETPPVPTADDSETPPVPTADDSETPPAPSAGDSETPPAPSADDSETPPVPSADDSETPHALSAGDSKTPLTSADESTDESISTGEENLKPKSRIEQIQRGTPAKMATGIVTYKDHPDLQPYIMKDLVRTGRKLGHGAFGVVEELSRGGAFYACKKLHDAITDAEDKEAMLRVSRFVSECKLLSDVRHPNIVQFMGLYFTDESPFPFLVIEELDASLDQFLEEKTEDVTIPLSLKLHIMCDVAKGLVYLHGRNPPVIHRDLTARNVLLNKAATHAKIGDLGNAIIVDPIKLASTLTQMPGAYLYMPPEALSPNAIYDSSLDMFSFGHLFLYTIIQVFPDQLLPPTYYTATSSAGGREIKARSEVERRSEYFEMLYNSQQSEKTSQDRDISQLIERCLNNIPLERPTASEALMITADLLGGVEDIYTQLVGKNSMDLVSLVDSVEKSKVAQDTLSSTEITAVGVDSIRVQQIKGGAPGVLKISKVTGRFRKKVQWSEYVFKITGTDPYLQYTRNNQVYERIQLSSVTSVDVLASTEDEDEKSDRNSGFEFAVHFSGKQSKSPWILQAHSNEERLSWMEAILPGSGNQNQTNEPVCPEYEEPYIIWSSGSCPKLKPANRQQESLPDATSQHQSQFSDGKSVEEKTMLGSAENREDFQSSHPTSQESVHYEMMECNPELIDNRLPTVLNTGSNPGEGSDAPSKETSSTSEELQGRQDETNQAHIFVLMNQMQKMMEQLQSIYASADDLGIRSSSEPKVKQVQLPPPPNAAPSDDDKTTDSNSDNAELNKYDMLNEFYDTFESEDDEDQSAHTPQPPLPSTQLTQSPVASPRKNKPPPLSTRATLPRIATRDNRVDSERICTPPPPIAPKPKKQPESPVPKPRTRFRSMGAEVLPEAPSGAHPSQQTHGSNMDQQRPIPRPRKPPAAPKQKEVTKKLRREESKAQMENIRGDLIHYAGKMKFDKMLVSDQNEAGDPIYAVGVERRPDWAKATITIKSSTSSTMDDTPLAQLQKEAVFIPPSAVQDLIAIGHGQYGQVYKATLRKGDSGIKRTVAVKTIKKYKTQRDKDDFLKEMNMMLGMIHPNIVQIFGLVQKDPPWMVLEYLQHGDLKNFLTVNKRPIEKLLRYMLDIAMGMHYIAGKGLVHRDLATRNIIVGDNEICKVSDFGLLREIPKDDIIYESMTAGGMFPIRWMAPESLQRREFSPASDVWSFSVVLWEMYYPKVTPYSNMRKSEVGRGVVAGSLRLEPPEEYPTVVKKIMKACWHSDPVKRPSFLLISTLLTSTAFGQ